MSNIIRIDFDEAEKISTQIEEEVEIVKRIVTKSENIENELNGIPPEFLKDTNTEIKDFKKQVKEIATLVDKFGYGFDQSVQNYYDLENNVVDKKEPINIGSSISNKGKFTWGYKRNGSGIKRVSTEEMERYLLSKGATKTYGNTYSINIDGVKYSYDLNHNFLYIGGKQIKCDFYLSKNYRNEKIGSVVSLLGGTGEDVVGPIRSDRISDNISFGRNALLVVPYSGVEKQYINPSDNVASVHFAQKVFNVVDDPTRSIVGFSEGSQVTARIVSENPKLYDNVVFVNGSTFSSSSYVNYVNNGYEGFKDANIIYLETKNGWPLNLMGTVDSTEQKGVVNSINSLIENGVDPSHITLVTNDVDLTNKVSTRINIDSSSMPPPSPKGEVSYYGHGRGAWATFNNSEIINYLSMSGKGGIL